MSKCIYRLNGGDSCQIMGGKICPVPSKQHKGCHKYKLGIRRDIKPETPETINEVKALARLFRHDLGGKK